MKPFRSLLTASLLVSPALASAQQWPTSIGLSAEVSPLPPLPSAAPIPAPWRASGPTTPPTAPTAEEPVSSAARLQLIIGQSLNGIGLGISLVTMVDPPPSGTVLTAATILGGGAGAIAAALATPNGITLGQSDAVTYSTLFGGIAAAHLLLGLDDALNARGAAGILAGGLTLGTGLGVFWATRRPNAGRVEFATSLGLWGTFLGAHLYLATRGYGVWDSSPTAAKVPIYAWSSLAWTAASLTAGMLLSSRVSVEASRMRVINVGGIGGWLVGGLVGFLASRKSDDEGTLGYSLGSMLGFGSGAVIAYLLTGDRERASAFPQSAQARRSGATVQILPGASSSPIGLSLAGSF